MVNIQSKIGGRAENQDFYGSAKVPNGELIVVCDGMGGRNGGRCAAETAVNTVLSEFSSNKNKDSVEGLKQAIKLANTKIWEKSVANTYYKGMGTTIVALLIKPDEAICCHVGDSRIYQICDGEILFRTFDHSYVFEMVKAGMLTEEEARLSNKSNIITRALGINSTVEVDVADKLSYQVGDRFVLCTDGIWGELPERQLVESVSQTGNIKQIAEQLVEKIDTKGFENGGNHDNLTIALVEIDKLNSATKKNWKSTFKIIAKFLKIK